MNSLKIKSDNDKLFRNSDFKDMFSETVSEFNLKPAERYSKFLVAENIVSMTTIECILENYEKSKKIVALNFANAMFAGGAYVLGGNAQEESLCRASMLYYTIRTQKEFYLKNRLHFFPDYTDTMIYSHNVPIIRNDLGELLTETYKCDFITSPAVNRTFAKFMFSEKKITAVMKRRIEKIIALAVSHYPDVLVLGAFGCGVFGNRRETVFGIFEEVINNYVPDNIKVIFAVPS